MEVCSPAISYNPANDTFYLITTSVDGIGNFLVKTRDPFSASWSDQACALGASIFAAVAAGLYPTIEEAQEAMASGCAKEYQPSAENHAKYEELYKEYKQLGAYCESR